MLKTPPNQNTQPRINEKSHLNFSTLYLKKFIRDFVFCRTKHGTMHKLSTQDRRSHGDNKTKRSASSPQRWQPPCAPPPIAAARCGQGPPAAALRHTEHVRTRRSIPASGAHRSRGCGSEPRRSRAGAATRGPLAQSRTISARVGGTPRHYNVVSQ